MSSLSRGSISVASHSHPPPLVDSRLACSLVPGLCLGDKLRKSITKTGFALLYGIPHSSKGVAKSRVSPWTNWSGIDNWPTLPVVVPYSLISACNVVQLGGGVSKN